MVYYNHIAYYIAIDKLVNITPSRYGKIWTLHLDMDSQVGEQNSNNQPVFDTYDYSSWIVSKVIS